MGLFDKLKGMISSPPAGPKETPFLDEYEDVRETRGGSMSKIYHGRHKQTKVIRVIKKVTPSTPEAVKKLLHEIEVCFSLDHPNIVKYLAFEKREKGYYILMELVEGSNLRDFLVDQVTVRGAKPPYVPYHMFTEMLDRKSVV